MLTLWAPPPCPSWGRLSLGAGGPADNGRLSALGALAAPLSKTIRSRPHGIAKGAQGQGIVHSTPERGLIKLYGLGHVEATLRLGRLTTQLDTRCDVPIVNQRSQVKSRG